MKKNTTFYIKDQFYKGELFPCMCKEHKMFLENPNSNRGQIVSLTVFYMPNIIPKWVKR